MDQYSASNNRPQYEALRNKYRVCEVYSPEPRSEVYCLRLNFNMSKLVYWRQYFITFSNTLKLAPNTPLRFVLSIRRNVVRCFLLCLIKLF